ncbi:MAG: DUF3179 domain-containing protein [Planctomycetes bacterium]|nr:DUF3179 domain-containing protein [Planctomycetota bacterium]
MQLGAVCSPIIDGEVLSFGTTGYTMNNTFVLYDRNTDSVWFPLTENSFDAVAGPIKGKKLPFLVEPEVMRLHAWAKLHPDTLVMLEPPPSQGEVERMATRRQSIARLVGTWDMQTDLDGQSIDAVMTIAYIEGEGFSGVWSSMGREMKMSNIRYNGKTLRFKREISPDQALEFSGTVGETSIEGEWTGDMGELECTGTKVLPEGEDKPASSQPDS